MVLEENARYFIACAKLVFGMCEIPIQDSRRYQVIDKVTGFDPNPNEFLHEEKMEGVLEIIPELKLPDTVMETGVTSSCKFPKKLFRQCFIPKHG